MGYTATGNTVHFPNQLGNIKPWEFMPELHRVTSVGLKFNVTQDVTLLVIDKIESSEGWQQHWEYKAVLKLEQWACLVYPQ